ncbi:hypothetical protein [Mesorhizobium sp. WSM2239]|uniref:Uncharacterized protein n=2 Tax=unclassified Mesorhizobium TaxID=325217 RepID=A0AAU8DII5_9HYPH
MSGLIGLSVIGPKEFRKMLEIYERACQVKAKLPETHIASIAANRLIAAFHDDAEDDAEPGVAEHLFQKWLVQAAPQGNA